MSKAVAFTVICSLHAHFDDPFDETKHDVIFHPFASAKENALDC